MVPRNSQLCGDGYIVGISLAAGLRGVNFHRSEGRGAQNELTGWFRMTTDAQNGPVLGGRCIFGAFDFFKWSSLATLHVS